MKRLFTLMGTSLRSFAHPTQWSTVGWAQIGRAEGAVNTWSGRAADLDAEGAREAGERQGWSESKRSVPINNTNGRFRC